MKTHFFLLILLFSSVTCAVERAFPTTIPGTPANNLLLDKATAFERTADLSQYKSLPELSGKLVGRGSGAAAILLQHWGDEFSTIYPGVSCEFSTGGASAGLMDVIHGSASVVAMRRPLAPVEISQLTTGFGQAPVLAIAGHHALAVYVDIGNPIAQLSVAQLEAIFSRTPRTAGPIPETWGDLGVEAPLDKTLIYRCALNRTVNLQFRKILFGDEGDFRYDLKCSVVPGVMMQAIAAEPGAIGLASIIFATAGVRVVPLTGQGGRNHYPTNDEALAGTYPLTIPFTLIINPTANPLTKEFVRFALSRRGQQIAAQLGAFPLDSSTQTVSLSTVQ